MDSSSAIYLHIVRRALGVWSFHGGQIRASFLVSCRSLSGKLDERFLLFIICGSSYNTHLSV